MSPQQPDITTMAIGEEDTPGDRPDVTSLAIGEEEDGGGTPMTTAAVGEEDEPFTTLAVGEEDSKPKGEQCVESPPGGQAFGSF